MNPDYIPRNGSTEPFCLGANTHCAMTARIAASSPPAVEPAGAHDWPVSDGPWDGTP